MSATKEIKNTGDSVVSAPEHYRSFRADLLRNGDGYKLVGELPGVTRESLKVTIDEDVLTVEGSTSGYSDELSVVRKELPRGHYLRQFRLSDSIDTQSVRARLENGILVLDLPKKEMFRPMSIKIED